MTEQPPHSEELVAKYTEYVREMLARPPQPMTVAEMVERYYEVITKLMPTPRISVEAGPNDTILVRIEPPEYITIDIVI